MYRFQIPLTHTYSLTPDRYLHCSSSNSSSILIKFERQDQCYLGCVCVHVHAYVCMCPSKCKASLQLIRCISIAVAIWEHYIPDCILNIHVKMAGVHYKMLHVFVYVCAVDVQLTTNARNTLEFISKIEYYMRYADCRSKHAALRACSECLFDVITFRRSTFFRFFCANVKICTFDFRQLVCAPLRSLNSQTEAYFSTIVQQ